MATIKDISKITGISVGTISNYINKCKPVSNEKAKIIEDAIEKLKYMPNNAARNLKKMYSNEIGVILPTFSNNYYLDIFIGIRNYFMDFNIFVSVYLSDNDPYIEQKSLNFLVERKVRGIIIVSCQPNNTEYFDYTFSGRDIPIVAIDHEIKDIPQDFITIDNETLVKQITSYLIDKGHRNIALFTGPETYTNERAAITGYCKAYESKGLQYNNRNIRSVCIDKESAFKASTQMINLNNPDYIITTSEILAIGVSESKALLSDFYQKSSNIISLGQDNWNSYTTNNLFTSIKRSIISLGKQGAKLLNERIMHPNKEKKSLIISDNNYSKIFNSISEMSTYGKNKDYINILMLDNQLSKQLSNIVTRFEKDTGIHVNIKTAPHKMMFDIISNNEKRKEYDILMFNISWLHELVQKNILCDIKDMIEKNKFDCSIYLENSMDYFGQYNDGIYGIPFMYTPQILYYRKDLFNNLEISSQYKEKYHLPLRAPRTWREFHNISEFFTLKHNFSSPTKYGTIIPAAYIECLVPEFYTRLRGYGAKIWDSKNKVCFKSPSMIKAYKDFISDLSLAPDKYMKSNYIDAGNEFIKGTTAMVITYPSFSTDMIDIEKSNVASEIGYGYIPGKESIMYGWSLGVSTNSNKKDEAFKFIEWSCGKEISQYMALLTGQSTITNVLENDYLLSRYPWLNHYRETYNYAQPLIPPHDKNKVIQRNSIDNIIGKNIYKVINCEVPFLQAIDITHEELHELFKSNGY